MGKSEQEQTQGFREETNPKNPTRICSFGQEANFSSCFRGNLNKLKHPEEKPKWWRVWKSGPSRELNAQRMLRWRKLERVMVPESRAG